MMARAVGGGGRGGIEPFIGKHRVLRYAVALVIDQTEPALCKGVALDGGSVVKIGGRVIGLRHAKSIFVHEAEKSLRPGLSALRQDRQHIGRAKVVAPRLSSRPLP